MDGLAILKALSDQSRLEIIKLLMEREAHCEVIAERMKLAPSTVSFHLKKLTAVGLISTRRDQYYTFYQVAPDVFKISLKDLIVKSKIKIQDYDQHEDAYKAKVLKSFFKYGRLTKIPSQKVKRQWILSKISENLQINKKYSIVEAKAMLSEIYDDTDALIKELKAFHFIDLSDGKINRKS